MQMLLTGEMIDAAQAEKWGLVSQVVPPEELDTTVQTLATQIGGKSGSALRMGKQLFYKQQQLELGAAYEVASEAMAINMMNHDAQEGISAFLQKRPPQWKHI